MTCLVCGGPIAITPRLFPEADDRWDCLTCGTWGTISERREDRPLCLFECEQCQRKTTGQIWCDVCGQARAYTKTCSHFKPCGCVVPPLTAAELVARR